jgi:putative nucleotidyltransferase with HDIG domain
MPAVGSRAMVKITSLPQYSALRGQAAGQFVPIPLESLCIDTLTNFNIFVPAKSEDQPVLYRAENLPFTEEVRKRLLEHDVERVCIDGGDQDKYQKYIEDNLDKILADDSIESPRKTEIVYSSATYLIKRLFESPWVRDGIRRSEKLVESTVDFILRDEAAFRNFLKVRSYDYYTYTHSVNVYVFSVALAQRAGIHEMSDLLVLGTGSLLHDIGKSLIDKRIISKSGPLTDEEWVIIKKHPAYGVNILRETGGVSEESYAVVSQHHERCDGSGYPGGLRAAEIHPYAKVSAIVDVFDAMTTQRVYRDAVSSFNAFLTMKKEMRAGFDDNVFREFVQLMAL